MKPVGVSFLRMPAWLARLLDRTWFGFGGVVAEGSDPASSPELIVHEEAHIAQEDAMGGGILRALGRVPARIWGCIRWGTLYVVSRDFRLQEEVSAFAAEMATVERCYWAYSAEIFAKDLAGRRYLWAARSELEALAALQKALGAIPRKGSVSVTRFGAENRATEARKT